MSLTELRKWRGPASGARVVAAIVRYMPGVLGVLGIAQRVANL